MVNWEFTFDFDFEKLSRSWDCGFTKTLAVMDGLFLENISVLLANTSANSDTLPFPISIWPLGVGFILGGLLGGFGNIMVITALMQSKDLKRNRCNWLVGNLALVDVVSCLSLISCGIQAIIQSIHQALVSHQLCFYMRLPSIISYNAGAILILAIGIDRMVALWWPTLYANIPKMYGISAVIISWVFGLMNAILGFIYKHPELRVPGCGLPIALRGAALKFWIYGNIVINILVIGSYAMAYHRAKSLASAHTANADRILRNNRLLTSLLICVGIYIIGWVLTVLLVFIVYSLSAPPSVLFHTSMYTGLLAMINVGCNFYVYYARSEDYRKAFKSVMGIRKNEVSAVSQLNVLAAAC